MVAQIIERKTLFFGLFRQTYLKHLYLSDGLAVEGRLGDDALQLRKLFVVDTLDISKDSIDFFIDGGSILIRFMD